MTEQEIDDLQEALSNEQQRANTAEGKMERMKLAHTPEGQTKMATEAANQIEELFCQGSPSREQRLNRIISIIRARLDTLCQGEPDWRD
jgi:hypothetical protein